LLLNAHMLLSRRFPGHRVDSRSVAGNPEARAATQIHERLAPRLTEHRDGAITGTVRGRDLADADRSAPAAMAPTSWLRAPGFPPCAAQLTLQHNIHNPEHQAPASEVGTSTAARKACGPHDCRRAPTPRRGTPGVRGPAKVSTRRGNGNYVASRANSSGNTISLVQHGTQTARNRNTATRMIVFTSAGASSAMTMWNRDAHVLRST